MAADLMEERHDCGADAPQGAEYTPDGTLCVPQAKCARSAFGGTRTSANISMLPHIIEACPSTTTKLIPPALHVDISQRISALDALTSKLLLVEENHAYRPIADKRAGGCATPPVGDISISPDVSEQVPDDEAEYYTPLEPSDSNPTQKIEHTYQIPCNPSESPDYRLPTKAPKFTNAPERGAVNATKPSNATAHKGASDDRTKKCSLCQRTSFLPSRIIYRVPQQDTKSYIATLTKKRPAQSSDARGFPDTCAPTSTAGQGAGNDGAESRPRELAAPCAAPVAEPATDDDVRYECPTGDQDTEYADIKASYPTKFGHADAVEISARNGFLDGGASRYAPPICIPISRHGEPSPESPASMYFTPQARSTLGSPTYSDASTLIDPDDALIKDEEKCRVFDSATLSDIPALHHTPESPKTSESPCEERLEKGEHIPYINTHDVVCDEQLNQDTLLIGSPNVISTPAIEPPSPQSTLGHGVPEELFQTILSYIWDVVWRPGARVNKDDYRGLGHLALVSRYWAKQVRHLILEELHIHDSRGVERMRDVLCPPQNFGFEHPATLIHDLRLSCSDSNPRWIHQVTQIVSKTPDLARNVILSLNLVNYRRSPQSSQSCPRGVFHYLPKTWPSLFGHFYRLTLKDVQFDRASDMFHLISQMPNLRSLNLNNVSWNPSSPCHSPDPLPSYLGTIMVFEVDRYGHGGRGTLPWILSSAAGFLPPKKMQSAKASASLPSVLCPYDRTSAHAPFAQPTQCDYILEMLDVFSHPDLSCILESPRTIHWEIERSKAGDFRRPPSARMFFTPRQRFANQSFSPAVGPSLLLSLETRSGNGQDPNHLYVTHIALNVLCFNPTLEELLLYNWGEFLDTTTRFEFLEAVEMRFTTKAQCSRLIQEHAHHVNEAIRKREEDSLTRCTYNYAVEGEEQMLWIR